MFVANHVLHITKPVQKRVIQSVQLLVRANRCKCLFMFDSASAVNIVPVAVSCFHMKLTWPPNHQPPHTQSHRCARVRARARTHTHTHPHTRIRVSPPACKHAATPVHATNAWGLQRGVSGARGACRSRRSMRSKRRTS
jgi:hypothetical protein